MNYNPDMFWENKMSKLYELQMWYYFNGYQLCSFCCRFSFFFFGYERVFNSTSRYLADLHNIDNPYFETMVGHIYPTGLHLNKANSSDTEAQFSDLYLSILNGIVSA